MKKYQGNIWTEELAGGTINIGFTQQFITETLGECFHITQSNLFLLAEGKPMLTIETNDGLKVVRAPVTGTVLSFSDQARDFPDRIVENDVILTVLPKGVKVPVATKSEVEASRPVNNSILQGNAAGQWFNMNINNNNLGD